MAKKNGRENGSPAFQFYPQDFWASAKVACMDASEVGIYLRLLSECFTQNGLPTEMDELDLIAMSLRVSPEDFRKSWERVLKRCFVLFKGRFWSPRMLREIESFAEYSEQQSQRGAEGGKKSGETRRRKADERKRASRGQEGTSTASDSEASASSREQTRSETKQVLQNRSPQPNPTQPSVNPPPSAGPPTGVTAVATTGPPTLDARPPGIQSEYATWAAVLDRWLGEERISLGCHRVLLDLLELRCLSEDTPKKLRLPRNERGWLDLAKEVDRDIPRATEALSRMQKRGGHEFSRHLSWVDADAAEQAKASKAEPGSLTSALAGIRLGRARHEENLRRQAL